MKTTAKPQSPQAKVAQKAESPSGAKRMQIVEGSDSDSESSPPTATKSPVAIKSPTAKSPKAAKPDVSAIAKSSLPDGFTRLQVVEASESESEEEQVTGSVKATSPEPSQVAGPGSPQSQELYPDIQIKLSKEGVEEAKDHANKLFASG